jgi:hypothetical protein
MVTMHCTLISHLFWGSWAAVQASCSDIDFDFIGYSDLRFDGYMYHKGELGLAWCAQVILQRLLYTVDLCYVNDLSVV